jgi:hypothetical protein
MAKAPPRGVKATLSTPALAPCRWRVSRRGEGIRSWERIVLGRYSPREQMRRDVTPSSSSHARFLKASIPSKQLQLLLNRLLDRVGLLLGQSTDT